MFSINELQNFIDKAVLELLTKREPSELYEPIRYILGSGGKRIRPVLTLLSCNLFSEQIDEAIKPALGFEVFHNFTLLHDDIMDSSTIRRNQPTVHTKWDINAGILSGDVMAILAYEYITSCRDEILRDVISIFNKTAREVCEGQQYDLNFEKMPYVGKDIYLKMIEMKTSVLLAGCMQVGAIIGGASHEESVKLYNLGKNLGVAFQLQDDLLDTFGDEKIFGKKIGNDIVANKKTYLLIKALEKADQAQKEQILNLLNGNSHHPEHKIRKMRNIFRELEIDKETRQLVKHYFNQALENLSEVNVPRERKQGLLDLSNSLLVREK